MSEYHVCGLVLMSRPEHSPTVLQALGEMPAAEMHANEGGRMMVTVEGDAHRQCAGAMITKSTPKTCFRSLHNEANTP